MPGKRSIHYGDVDRGLPTFKPQLRRAQTLYTHKHTHRRDVLYKEVTIIENKKVKRISINILVWLQRLQSDKWHCWLYWKGDLISFADVGGGKAVLLSPFARVKIIGDLPARILLTWKLMKRYLLLDSNGSACVGNEFGQNTVWGGC